MQRNAIDELFDSKELQLVELDRPILNTCIEMTQTEFAYLETLVRVLVYEHARSHFVCEICDPGVRRFLNALRIRHEEGGQRMPWIA